MDYLHPGDQLRLDVEPLRSKVAPYVSTQSDYPVEAMPDTKIDQDGT